MECKHDNANLGAFAVEDGDIGVNPEGLGWQPLDLGMDGLWGVRDVSFKYYCIL